MISVFDLGIYIPGILPTGHGPQIAFKRIRCQPFIDPDKHFGQNGLGQILSITSAIASLQTKEKDWIDILEDIIGLDDVHNFYLSHI
jgi:hypothetical protein